MRETTVTTVDISEVVSLFDKLQKNIETLPKTLNEKLSPQIITFSIDNINQGVDINGNSFVPLKRGDHKPLIKTGSMSDRYSFTTTVENNEIMVKNTQRYSIYHQLGTGLIPARTFMGIPRILQLAEFVVSILFN